MIPSRKYTTEERVACWEECGKVCYYCDAKVAKPGSGAGRKTHFDHVVPSSSGGSDNLENLRPCCRDCNCSKASTPLEIWIDRKLDSIRRQERRLVEIVKMLEKLELEESNLET